MSGMPTMAEIRKANRAMMGLRKLHTSPTVTMKTPGVKDAIDLGYISVAQGVIVITARGLEVLKAIQAIRDDRWNHLTRK